METETTKYEAIALALVNADSPEVGEIISTFPPTTSPLLLSGFFAKLYVQYDQRFVYSAPRLEPITRRLSWDPDSPALHTFGNCEYDPRVGYPEEEPR